LVLRVAVTAEDGRFLFSEAASVTLAPLKIPQAGEILIAIPTCGEIEAIVRCIARFDRHATADSRDATFVTFNESSGSRKDARAGPATPQFVWADAKLTGDARY